MDLKKFNFGKPEILNMILVLKLKNKFKNKGIDVRRCTIRTSGFFFLNKLYSGSDEKKIMNK